MSPIQLIFLIVSGVGLLSALGTVLARNLVHAALFLVAFFFTVACQFVLLEAEFLAAMQVLVYIGAVSILLLFGIMLTRNIQGDETTGGHWGWKLPGAIVALGVLGVLLFGINAERGRPGQASWSQLSSRPGGVNPRIGGPGSIALAASPSGEWIASADLDGRVRLWSADGRQRAALHLDGLAPTAVAFSPDSRVVAAADDSGRARAWDVATLTLVLDRSGGRPGVAASLAVGPPIAPDTPGDRILALGGADGVLRVWVGPDPVEVRSHDGAVAAMAFGAEGLLVTAGADRTVASWDLRAGADPVRVSSAPPGRPIAAAAVGPVPPGARWPGGVSGPLVALASFRRGEPGLWDLRVLAAPDGATLLERERLPGIPVAVSLAGDARVAALVLPETTSDADGRPPASVRIWELAPGADPVELAVPVAVGPDARLVAGADRLALASSEAPLAFRDPRTDAWAPPTGLAVATPSVIADMPRAVGDELMTRYVVPFEVAGLMLTAALIGAIALARQGPRDLPALPEATAATLAAGRPIPPSAPSHFEPVAAPAAPRQTPDARPSR